MTTFIVFDTETTGLPLPSIAPIEQQPKIIEIGAVRVDLTDTVRRPHNQTEFSQLINPGVPISYEVTQLTNIKDRDVVRKPRFTGVLPSLVNFFTGVDFVLAHNAAFDCLMLELELKRIAKVDEFPWPSERICTVQEYTPIFGRRPKLVELYQRTVRKPLAQTHRALDDVKALVEICDVELIFRRLHELKEAERNAA